ncbi:MAG: AAA family ATPase [Egibacteraceae bacterium]
MLRSFRLGNHRSFRDEHELLLMPVYENEKDVSTVAAIYGANASGKSNLLDGLQFMRALIVRWGLRKRGADSGIARTPFRLSPSSELEPSIFAVELVLNGVRHTYGFSADDERVHEEWLYSYPLGRRRVLFERHGRDIDFGSTVTQRSKAEVVESLLTEKTLFLSLSARVELPEYRSVFEWFYESLLSPRMNDSRPIRITDERLARFIDRSNANRGAYLELARAADVGITDIQVEYVSDPLAAERAAALAEQAAALEEEHARMSDEQAAAFARRANAARERAAMAERESRRATLLLSHGTDKSAAFGLADESDGTRLWLHLLPSLITCLAEGRTMVIDEIDSSLHPLLVRKLVGMFRSPETNPNHAQLIFTTHDAFLLAPIAGEPGVDRDQVWFVEKQPDGSSTLYPLTDFKPRNEHNLARRYLGGSYGAIPFLDDLDSLHIPEASHGDDAE